MRQNGHGLLAVLQLTLGNIGSAIELKEAQQIVGKTQYEH